MDYIYKLSEMLQILDLEEEPEIIICSMILYEEEIEKSFSNGEYLYIEEILNEINSNNNMFMTYYKLFELIKNDMEYFLIITKNGIIKIE